ncbi:MAG: hypothetical protein II875_05730 [Clostridia bacterium]|nr:hypothetical protein [Clostridia bacterium]
MKNWCIQLSGVSAGQAKFALKEISALVYAYTRRAPAVCHADTGDNTILLVANKDDAPPNGYRLRVHTPKDGRQLVSITGADAAALQNGCMDFCGRFLSQASLSRKTADPYYIRPLFSEEYLPPSDFTSAPRILRRGLWTWGLAVYDWRGYLENMARLKLNELILWNDYAPVNGREIVSYAHELGIHVLWGYAWGWDTTMRLDTSQEATNRIVATFERQYASLGGDGIYFQSFTETSSETLDGVLIAEAVVDFVNRTARELLKRHPGLRLQFGLHADSVRSHTECIAKVDPRVEIIWENCGGFPYHSCPDVVGDFEETRAFTQKLLSLRPGAGTGAVFKGMTQLDWQRFVHQSGPEVLGCAGEEEIAARLPAVRRIWRYIAGEWLDHGALARDILGLYAGHGNAAVYNLVEAGLFEREISLPAALYAELCWDCRQDWQRLVRETVQRADISV